MKFSILITSFNKGKYLDECIKSCLNQSEKNFEIIVCDNYSDDNSNSIFKKYEKNINLIRKKKISTSSPTNQIDLIKLGFESSTGDVICLLDADDYFFPEKLNILKKNFLENDFYEVIFDLPLVKNLNSLKKFKLKNKKQKYIWPTIINTSSIVLTRKFLNECIEKGIFEKFDFLEVDFRINVYARCIKKNFKVISEDVTVYRKVDDSIMVNIKKYSKKWWIKRKEAHEFMRNFFLKNQLVYENKFDYYLTDKISKFLL